MKLRENYPPARAIVVRLPEPGESQRQPVAFETRADRVERIPEGVLVLHDDELGYAFYPRERIVRVDYRAEP